MLRCRVIRHVDEGLLLNLPPPLLPLLGVPLPTRTSSRRRRSMRSTSRVSSVGVELPSELADLPSESGGASAANTACISMNRFINAGCSPSGAAALDSASSFATTIVSRPTIVEASTIVAPTTIVASPPSTVPAALVSPPSSSSSRGANEPCFFNLASISVMASEMSVDSVSLAGLAPLIKGILRRAEADDRFRTSFTRHFFSTCLSPSPHSPSPNPGAGFCAIMKMARIGWMSAYGGLPSAISIPRIPNDQISARESCPVCWITSGAIQNGVPITVFRFFVVSESWPATPKSANLTLPARVTRTFPPLMSRWTCRLECMYCNPSNVPCMIVAISGSSIVL
eukprot:m.28560 g.28560  ORF g.28560 m.28560 type:complete len:341 (-) comp12032_c0_seq1:627-1649(-)